MLLKTCILSGCDYLQSIKGVAFKTAVKLMKDAEGNINEIFHILNSSEKYNFDFNRALLTFKHQVVYDIKQKKQRYLSPLPDDFPFDKSFLGDILDNDLSHGISSGLVDPDTHKPFSDKLASDLT